MCEKHTSHSSSAPSSLRWTQGSASERRGRLCTGYLPGGCAARSSQLLHLPPKPDEPTSGTSLHRSSHSQKTRDIGMVRKVNF